jgi:NADPH-dependent 2,4-dienoyl-CoA reductase/sulfur reductase-like enzyme
VRRLALLWLPSAKHVVVVGGGLVGRALAGSVAGRCRVVTLLEAGPNLGLPMASPRRWTAVRRAGEHHVELVRNATLVEITATDVAYDVGGGQRRVAADEVIIAGDVHPGAPLADQLRAHGIEVHVVGDAGEVGYIEGAVHSAWRVARSL